MENLFNSFQNNHWFFNVLIIGGILWFIIDTFFADIFTKDDAKYKVQKRDDGKFILTDKVTGEVHITTAEGCLEYGIRIVEEGDSYEAAEPRTKNSSKDVWLGNGSGLIISKEGYIVTNHHVINDANDIEIEFILNGELQKFNTEIVKVDKSNDLAILKIDDINFKEVENLPYNFKSRPSDVGTKVYAYGYPMALSSMGKEIKITDGVISAKTGFEGDITTYQISAAIQGGNSGGPLFDEKGNFIGINSSMLGADVANNVGYTVKSSYILNLIDVLPKTLDLPSSKQLELLPLTEQVKAISKYVVLIKVK